MTCRQSGDPIVLTREAEASEEYSGWGSREYYTGISLQEEEGEPAVGNYIYLEMYVPAPGAYYPWVLAALNRYDTSAQKQLKITITPVKAHSQSRVDSVVIDISPTRALEWMPSKGRKRWLEFPDFGRYFLTVEGMGDEDVQIIFDKLLLTGHPRYAPTGYATLNDTVEVILPPAWAFGVIYGGYTDQEETVNRIDSILAADLPIDGYWIDSWFWNYTGKGSGPKGYIDFRGDPVAYPDMAGLMQYMQNRQIKSGLWIWNAIQKTGNEEVFRTFEDRGYFDGVAYENESGWHNDAAGTPIGDIDFENEAAVDHWKNRLKPFFDQGLDFLKLDRSSATPFMKAAFEATQELGLETRGRGLILSHLHSAYDPEMKRYPAKWTGDAKIAWSQPDYPDLGNYSMGAFRENVLMVANPRKSTYEVPFLTHDAGGYNFFGARSLSDSLYMRWIQFSMFNPLTTVFTSHENPTANLPFRFSGPALDNFRYYSHLKLRLFPYIYSYAHITRETGRKMIQGDVRYQDQYRFGRELLVAPVTTPNAEQRQVFLPPGKWIDFYDHQAYEGDQVIDYPAPIDRLPLFVKAGSILPLRPYARSVELGSNDTLSLRAYPGEEEEGAFTLREDDGISNDYLSGRVASTTFRFEQRPGRRLMLYIEPVEGDYEGMKPERSYRVEVLLNQPPASVDFNGNALPDNQYEYDDQRRMLNVELGVLPKSEEHRLRVRF